MDYNSRLCNRWNRYVYILYCSLTVLKLYIVILMNNFGCATKIFTKFRHVFWCVRMSLGTMCIVLVSPEKIRINTTNYAYLLSTYATRFYVRGYRTKLHSKLKGRYVVSSIPLTCDLCRIVRYVLCFIIIFIVLYSGIIFAQHVRVVYVI